MRLIRMLVGLAVGTVAIAQTTPTSLLVTTISGVTSSWAGECAAGIVDNRSQYTRLNVYHAVAAQGSGSWTVTLQYSNTSCSGPWSSYGSTATINQSSNPAIAYAIDPPFTPAQFIKIAITGSATATYTAQKGLYLSTALGSLSFPLTVGQGGTNATTSAGALASLLSGNAQGTSTNKVQMAGTNSGVSGALLCNDASGNATTTGCPLSQVFDIRKYGAVCDGTTNDSPAIQAAITAAVNNGGGVVQGVNTGANCALNSTLLMGPAAHDVIFDGGGTTLYPNSSTIPAMTLNGCTRCSVRNTIFDRPLGFMASATNVATSIVVTYAWTLPTPPFGIWVISGNGGEAMTVTSVVGSSSPYILNVTRNSTPENGASLGGATSFPSGGGPYSVVIAASGAYGMRFASSQSSYFYGQNVTFMHNYDGLHTDVYPGESRWVSTVAISQYFNGIDLPANNDERFEDLALIANGNDGIRIGGIPANMSYGGVTVNGASIYSNHGVNVHVAGTAADTSTQVSNVVLANIESDSAFVDGFNLDYVGNVILSNCNSTFSSYGYNFKLGPYADNVTMSNLFSYVSPYSGLFINGSTHVVGNNIAIYGSGIAGGNCNYGSCYGVDISNGASNISLTSVVSGNIATGPYDTVQTGGVMVDSTSSAPTNVYVQLTGAPITNSVGTVDTNGTAVTWDSGDSAKFAHVAAGHQIIIGSTRYTVQSVGASPYTSLTLVSTAGIQSGAAYTVHFDALFLGSTASTVAVDAFTNGQFNHYPGVTWVY